LEDQKQILPHAVLPRASFSKEGNYFGYAKIKNAPPFAKGGWEGFAFDFALDVGNIKSS